MKLWPHILGHDAQISRLVDMLQQQRLPQALLFCGLRGIGKMTVARSVAAAAVSEQSAPLTITNPSVQRALHEQHPDVHILRPLEEKTDIVIDQVRDLTAKLQLHPLEAPLKIAIVDDAHAMNTSASNALLKILEEPPTATHFILIADSVSRLLPTICSRCQIIPFAPLPSGVIADALQRDTALPPDKAHFIAQLSQGSLGLAQQLDPNVVDTIVGQAALFSRNASSSDILQAAEEWSSDPEHLQIALDILMSLYRDRLILATTGAQHQLMHPKAVHPHTPPQRVFRDLAAIAAARRALEGPANKQLLLEHLFFTLSAS